MYESPQGYYSSDGARSSGFFAAEVLADLAGAESIFAYCAALGAGATWHEAFQANFGMTVDEFYEVFEERRASGFPEEGKPRPDPSKPGPFDHLLMDSSLPCYITWDIGSEVDLLDVESAVLIVKLMHELAQSLGLPDPRIPIDITIYKDMEQMACKYSMQTRWDLEKSRKYWENGGAVAGKGNVNISASTPERLRADPHRMKRLMAHELTHAHFQHGLTGFSEQKSGMSPRWLAEGTANLVTTLLLGENYPDALERGHLSRAEEIARAVSTGLTLREAEVWPPNEGGMIGVDEAGLNTIKCIYSCGYPAAELLASHVGMNRLFDYYQHVEAWMEPWDYAGHKENAPREWRIAFEKAYGMTLEEFYDLFEDHRAAGFPEVGIPKTVER